MRLQSNEDPWKDVDSEALQQSTILLNSGNAQNMFAEYFFDINQNNHTDNLSTK